MAGPERWRNSVSVFTALKREAQHPNSMKAAMHMIFMPTSDMPHVAAIGGMPHGHADINPNHAMV
jgi:hypothetical protein